MMKKLILTLTCVSLLTSVFGQYQLDVEGNASIKGRLILDSPGHSTFIGTGAGDSDDGNFNYNLFLGAYAGTGTISGSRNIAIGAFALNANKIGFNNTMVGVDAGLANLSSKNTFLGTFAGRMNTTGSENTFLGQTSGQNNIGGNENTFLGSQSGQNNITGSNNTYLGFSAGHENQTGEHNTFVGSKSGELMKNGGFSTMIGSLTGSLDTAGIGKTYAGYAAGGSGNGGDYNTFIGHLSGFNVQSSKNTFLGAFSGFNNITGEDNTFVGYQAGQNNTTADFNTFIGNQTAWLNTTGSINTFLGNESGYNNTTGNQNTFIGEDTGYNNTNGKENTFLGEDAGRNNTTGQKNTFLGNNTGLGVEDADNITLVGYNADVAAPLSISNATGIGQRARITASNQMVLGDAAIQSIRGSVSWSTIADARFQRKTKEDVPGIDFIDRLRPVSFQYDMTKLSTQLKEDDNDKKGTLRSNEPEADPIGSDAPGNRLLKARRQKEGKRYTGFIAQEVADVTKDLSYEFSGLDKPQHEEDVYALRYSEFVPALVKATQELVDIIEDQRRDIDQLEVRVQQLMDRLTAQEQNKSENSLPALSEDDNTPSGGLLVLNTMPNPAREMVRINYQLPQSFRQARIQLYSPVGQLVRDISLAQGQQGEITLSLKGLAAGTYMYTLVGDDQPLSTQPLLIQ